MIRSPNLTAPIRHQRLGLLATAVCTLALLAAPDWAQTSTTAGAAQDANRMPVDNSLQVVVDNRADKHDASLMNDLAKASLAGIDAGKLALEKSSNQGIRAFAQRMIDDHTQSLGEVEALARIKGVVLPDGSGAIARTRAAALQITSGKFFDREYARHAGVGDHKKTLKLLQKIQKDAKDDDLKALATRLRPMVEHHLVMARELVNAKKAAS